MNHIIEAESTIKKELIKSFDVYEEHDCFCPFCSDSTIHVEMIVNIGKYIFNESIKLRHTCCDLTIEVEFDEEFVRQYKKNFYMGYLSNDKHRPYDLVEEYNKKALELKEKVVSLYKVFMEKGYEEFMEWRVKS